MGQQASKEPLGYVYHSTAAVTNVPTGSTGEKQKDFILENPELYWLQPLCEQCSSTRDCSDCKKEYLENDLAYVDQTYYADLTRYATTEKKMKSPITTKRRRRLMRGVLSIDLSYRSLAELSSSISNFRHLTSLNLSNNQLTVLPEQVGYLKNLVNLDVSDNNLTALPGTVGLLSKLNTLYASCNQLQTLPPSIGQLSELNCLVINENKITFLPKEISGLTKLMLFNVSYNPIYALPAEISTLGTLKKLFTEGCDFQQEYVNVLIHDPPSLMETCARTLVRHKLDIPLHLKSYLSRVKECSYCHGPYFDRYVIRYKRTERLVLEHTLCSAHWSDERDRILTMFSERPDIPLLKPFFKQDEMDNLTDSDTRCSNSISTVLFKGK